MQSPPPSTLSVMVPEEQSSRFYPSPHTHQHLSLLKKQLNALLHHFQQFKEDTLSALNEWMGRISTNFYRSLKERAFLEVELQKSKQIQATMRGEVIQLKQMINEAMKDYACDLRAKEKEISVLKEELDKYRSQEGETDAKKQDIKIEEDVANEAVQELEVIQQQSQQATFSSVTSLRDFKEEDKQSSNEGSQKQQISIMPESHSKDYDHKSKLFDEIQTQSLEQSCKIDYHKRTKSFIDNFRKTIEESFQQTKPQDMVSIPKLKIPQDKENLGWATSNKVAPRLRVPNQDNQHAFAQPLREMINLQKNIGHGYPFTDSLKKQEPKAPPLNYIPQTLYLHQEDPVISNSSSSSQLGNLSEVQRQSEVNMVKHLQTPQYTFFKKKPASQSHQRFKTQPSSGTPSHQATNNYFTHKPSHSSTQIDRKPLCQRSHSDGKSVKSSGSKEKIKVTSRMIDEMGYHPRKNHNAPNAKVLVHLGGKSLFRKFLLEIKTAFKKYTVYLGSQFEELKYEGQFRGRQRWGRGRLFYRNGLVYEGDFQQNRRHGRGSLSLNGISIYEGEWVSDMLYGQGYIKSMKFMSNNCPALFQQASFCGNLVENRCHGIGTIFLNPKEKIVTKFQNGCPVGELTYYNLHEIQFGVWPSD